MKTSGILNLKRIRNYQKKVLYKNIFTNEYLSVCFDLTKRSNIELLPIHLYDHAYFLIEYLRNCWTFFS